MELEASRTACNSNGCFPWAPAFDQDTITSFNAHTNLDRGLTASIVLIATVDSNPDIVAA